MKEPVTHRKLLGFIRDATFWRSVVPQLAAGGATVAPGARSLTESEVASVRLHLRQEGYFRVDALLDRAQMARLEEGMSVLTAAGWPALFVFLFDEPWLVYARLDELLGNLLGRPYRRLAAVWAWCLERTSQARGWPPHRDHVARATSGNVEPESLTLWVPVTEATADNGCIYVLPATCDPGYSTDLSKCSARTLQDVRALPTHVGSVLGWNHQLLHWGGRASAAAASPRMSLSAEFQRSHVPPLDEVLEEPVPSFEERLALVGKQLIAYQHMQPPSAQLLELAEELVKGTRYAAWCERNR